ncbi:hypothetical protein [Roseivivax sp. CAU 1753]
MPASWSTPNSPVAGRADVASVSFGDPVIAGQTDALTTFACPDPFYVDMMEASARNLSVQNGIVKGTLTQNDTLRTTLISENGDVYRGTGQLGAPGNSVSTTAEIQN